MLRKNQLLLLLTLLWFGTIQARDSATDLDALRVSAEQGSAQALKLLEESAAADNPLAIIHLGTLYVHGSGAIAQNADEGLRWFRKAVELGDSRGWVNIGLTYLDGYGVDPDQGKALAAYRKATAMGNAEGELAVGIFYQRGWGVEPDGAEAARWFRLAAEQDQPMALLELGRMVLFGRGVKANSKQGLDLMERSARLGNSKAGYTLGTLYERGHMGNKDLATARQWFTQAAASNHPEAAYRLGYMMANGRGGKVDMKGAVSNFRIAARQGQINAMNRLYEAYAKGVGIEADTAQARYWLVQSAQYGSLSAQATLTATTSSDPEPPFDSRPYTIYRDKHVLADSLLRAGDTLRAEPMYREVVEHILSADGWLAPAATDAMLKLEQIFRDQQRWKEAAELLERHIETAEKHGWNTAAATAEDRNRLQLLRDLAKRTVIRYDSLNEPPDEFDLVARTNADGSYLVDGKSYGFDGLVQLIVARKAKDVVVRESNQGLEGTLCIGLIGAAGGAMVFARSDRETIGVRFDLTRESIEQATNDCRGSSKARK